MDKSRIAEWVLSLVMEPAQAVSVTGDLMETAASHNEAWFWSNVFRTLAGTVWSDFKEHPFFVVWLATRGVFVHFGLFVAEVICFVCSCAILEKILSRDLMSSFRLWEWAIVVYGGIAVTAFFAGAWIARRSFGKDIAVCVVIFAIRPSVTCGLVALFFWPISFLLKTEFPNHLVWSWGSGDIVLLSCYLVGATLMRRRRQVSAARC
jgi:hypothetical protein